MSDQTTHDVIQSPYQESILNRYLALKSKIKKMQTNPYEHGFELTQKKKEKLFWKQQLLLAGQNDNAQSKVS